MARHARRVVGASIWLDLARATRHGFLDAIQRRPQIFRYV